ncbi:MAG: glycoside hydrolase family 2 TIM barrel-domain containing protein [Promethearchaeota archaeon]
MAEIQQLTEWEFFRGATNKKETINYLDLSKQWQSITVPHTWNDQDVQEGGAGMLSMLNPKKARGYIRAPHWYRTVLNIPKEYEKNRLFVRFGAVGSVAEVYFNGTVLGQHRGAFSAFCYEITDHAKYGKPNILAIKADNTFQKDIPPLSGDFPVMGGMYRPVHLIIKEEICISPLDYASSGIYIAQTRVSKEQAHLDIKTIVNSTNNLSKTVKLTLKILDQEKQEILVKDQAFTIENSGDSAIEMDATIENPHLWNGRKNPYLYQVVVQLYVDNTLLDEERQQLGLRYYRIDPETGFYLNGVSYPMYGVSRHQDRFDVGWALTEKHQQEDMDLIYEMGARGVRLAHYQHSDYFYSQCDQKGIMVWAEIALVNRVKFNRKFWDVTRTMLIELIKQNYNHPSIMMWGLCNELGIFQLRDPSPVVAKLQQVAKQEDPTRNTTLATVMVAKFRKKLNNVSDIFACNIYPGWYKGKATDIYEEMDAWNKCGNERGLGISEYGAGGSIYQHEEFPKKIAPVGKWHPEEYQSLVHEATFQAITETPYVWGSFVWNMFDFSSHIRNEGDHPGRNDKGLVTFDRKVRKDAYFFYQANLSEEPMVHITSKRFTRRGSPELAVKVYSNCDEIQLHLNGQDLGLMEKGKMNIFRYPKITLKANKNQIKVIGRKNSVKIEDNCEWSYIEWQT